MNPKITLGLVRTLLRGRPDADLVLYIEADGYLDVDHSSYAHRSRVVFTQEGMRNLFRGSEPTDDAIRDLLPDLQSDVDQVVEVLNAQPHPRPREFPSETIRRAFRRTGRGQTDTTLIAYEPGVRVDWYTVTTRDRTGGFAGAHHEWFDSTGAHGPQYMTEAELPEHLRGRVSSPERIQEQYENMTVGLVEVKHGRPSVEIPLAEVGDVEAHIRQASRRQVVLSDEEAEAAVAYLSGAAAYDRD